MFQNAFKIGKTLTPISVTSLAVYDFIEISKIILESFYSRKLPCSSILTYEDKKFVLTIVTGKAVMTKEFKETVKEYWEKGNRVTKIVGKLRKEKTSNIIMSFSLDYTNRNPIKVVVSKKYQDKISKEVRWT